MVPLALLWPPGPSGIPSRSGLPEHPPTYDKPSIGNPAPGPGFLLKGIQAWNPFKSNPGPGKAQRSTLGSLEQHGSETGELDD